MTSWPARTSSGEVESDPGGALGRAWSNEFRLEGIWRWSGEKCEPPVSRVVAGLGLAATRLAGTSDLNGVWR